jgi:3-hydroxybutyrate dehydrogenase
MELNGKVALVTGAASGLGQGIAKRFVEAGGRVVIADLNLDAAKATAASLAGEDIAIGVGMDVSDEEQVSAGAELAAGRFSCRTPASRSCIRSRSFLSRSGRS